MILGVHHAVCVDRQHHLARLVGDDGGVGDQEGVVLGRARDADAAELAGRDQAVGIGEHGAAADRAGALVDDVVDEVHRALVQPVVLVDQMRMDHRLVVARRGQPPRADRALVGEEVRLGHVEVEIDRVELDDVVSSVWSLDQVADVDPPVGDPALEGCGDLGEAEVELGLAELRPGPPASVASAACSSALRSSSVALATAEVVTSCRRGPAPAGPARAAPAACSIWALRPVGRRLVGARVDDEEELACLDDLAVLEADLLQIARDPRPDLDLLHGLEPPGELVPLGQPAHQRGRHRHRRSCRRLLCPGGTVTAVVTAARPASDAIAVAAGGQPEREQREEGYAPATCERILLAPLSQRSAVHGFRSHALPVKA